MRKKESIDVFWGIFLVLGAITFLWTLPYLTANKKAYKVNIIKKSGVFSPESKSTMYCDSFIMHSAKKATLFVDGSKIEVYGDNIQPETNYYHQPKN